MMAILIERKRRRRRKEEGVQKQQVTFLPDCAISIMGQQQEQQNVLICGGTTTIPCKQQQQAQVSTITSVQNYNQSVQEKEIGDDKLKRPFHSRFQSRNCLQRQSQPSNAKSAIHDHRLPLLLLLVSVAFTLTNLMHFASATSTSLAGNAQATSTLKQSQQQQQSVISMPLVGGHSGGVSTSGKARYKTMYACEDRQLTMDCDFGTKINLIRANYGRFSVTQCNEQGQLDLSTDCMSPITFRIMRDRCQDKQRCSVNATSAIFGDKCPKTPKYLEVHFQCQPDPRATVESQQQQQQQQPYIQAPDRVDVRNHSQFTTPIPIFPSLSAYPSTTGAASSPILPPNNPSSSSNPLPSSLSSTPPSTSFRPAGQVANEDINDPQQPAVQPLAVVDRRPAPTLQPFPVMNSEMLSYSVIAPSLNHKPNNSLDPMRPNEPILVTLRHTHTENMSNPRCVSWDQVAGKWTEFGSQILDTNQTHTTCAFDQATSYMLVMDYLGPLYSTISPPPNNGVQQQPSQIQPVPAIPGTVQDTQPSVPLNSPYPGLIELQPTPLDQLQGTRQQQTQLAPGAPSSVVKFFSIFGYLLAIVFVAAALMTIAFIASTMRSSAGAALKSLGNFTAFGGPKYKTNRRADGNLHNKGDLLVINNQNGHQFLYAPANSTKINSSSSTHILSAGGPVGQHHQGTLHQIQQQQMYSGNATLSNLSGTGGQSNNYYYDGPGFMGLSNLFQHQQQQQQSQIQNHLSQHHLNQIGQHHHQQQQQAMTPAVNAASYHHQGNKSTLSTESANSSPSSSGVESGSTSMQQQQQQSCLVMNNNSNDYNLMSHQLAGSQSNYGQHQMLGQQSTVMLNAHYSSSGVPVNQQQQRLHQQQLNSSMRDHIYECVDDDKPYAARLLLPMATNLNPSDQFNSSTLGHQLQHQQQMNNSRMLTLSSRLLQNSMQQQQQQLSMQGSQTSKRPVFSHPAIIRDNQAAKTNIICSKIAQVTPQRATEINKSSFHDVMAIYNGDTTTTTAANSSSSGNSTGCYSRSESNNFVVGGNNNNMSVVNNKLSTDC